MSVQETNGYLDVENATLRSSKIEVTSNLAIGNTNPQHAFSVGSNLYVDTESSNVLSVKGNVVTEGIKMGFLEIIPSYDFAAVSNVGNVTANTIIFTNDNQGFVATGNATIGSTLTVSGFRITAAAAAEDDLDAITTSTDDKPNAGTTENPIHLTGATTATSYTTGILQVGNSTNQGGMGVAGNVYVNQGVYTQDLSAENVVSNLAVNTDDLFVDIVNSRVGIGKTEPTVALDVVGAVTTSSALTVGANFAVNTDDLFVDTVNSRVGIGKTEPTVALDVVGAVSTSGDLTVTGTSKVGIGTDTLDAVLNVGSGTLASGDQILKLNTDSPWAFEHETDGLALRSSAANKKLYVQASDFSNVATFDVTTSNVGIGLTDPASKLHVMGDIIGRNVSNTHTITGTDGGSDTFTLLPDQNRVVVTHVGSSAADGAYTVNMTGGIPTAIGSILYLEIVSSKTNTDGVSHTHSTTLQIAADTVLTTGPITVAAVNNAGDVYERTLRRTIIRTSDGWKDYSVYPKVSVPTTDDAIIFSTTENTTQDTAGSDKPLTERLRITGNGNVGVGTTSPFTPLHISSTNEITTSPAGSGVSQMRYGSTNSTVLFGVSSTAGHISAYDTSSFSTHRNLCFNADGGNVGVGTMDPNAHLDVAGTILSHASYRKFIGVNGVSTSDKVYLGRFSTYAVGIIEIGSEGSSKFAINKYEVFRHYDAIPIVNGMNTDRYHIHKFYWKEYDNSPYYYDLWHTPAYGGSSVDGNYRYRITAQNYSFPDTEPSSTGSTDCDTGMIIKNATNNDIRIGIGTDNPVNALHINQFGRVDSGTTLDLEGQQNSAIAMQYGSGSYPNARFLMGINGNYDLHFWYDSNGGTASNRGYIRHDGSGASLNFTGQHRTFIKDVPFFQVSDLEGLIVSSDQNKYIKMSGGIEAGSNAITTNESLPIVSLSTTTNDKKCFGVISASEDPEKREEIYGNFVSVDEKEKGDTRVYINSVGEGAIWVTNINGSLESGDYITTSNVAGYGQKQDSEFLANYTVAKITMDCDFEPATQPVQIIRKEMGDVNYWVKTTYENVTEEEYSNITEENRRTITETVYTNEDGEIFPEQNEESTYVELEQTTYQKITKEESKTEQEGYELEVRQELVNVLDEHGQIQWEDDPSGATEKAYKIRYLDANGVETDEANHVYKAAFVGCTYHCG